LFIPFFLIGVGMLVDFSVLLKGFGALKVAGVMIVFAVATKFLAAWATQKTFKLSDEERQLIFGLSNARVGATLAVVLVGYNIILGETAAGDPIRLLNEDVLNGTILMILVTCTISSLVAERASRKIALLESALQEKSGEAPAERILISLAYPETVNDLVDLAFLLQPDKIKSPLYALHVVDEQDEEGKNAKAGKKMMEHVTKHAAATDNTIIPISRYDVNISNGIIFTIKEYSITDVVIGLHHKANEETHFFGPLAERILERTNETIYIYKASQPVNTLKRIVVAVSPKAVYEQGFMHWFNRIRNVVKETGLPITLYGDEETLQVVRQVNASTKPTSTMNLVLFADWEEFLIFSREVKQDDLFIIVSSRKGYLSYNNELAKLPRYLTRYFAAHSFIILFPAQFQDYSNIELQPIEKNAELIEKAGDYVKKMFSKKQ
jgi:hypothetical protein